MADHDYALLPPLSFEDRHRAAAQFDRAQQLIAGGNRDYGIHLLLDCCRTDPGTLIYRQALRRAEKARYTYNMRGCRWAWLTASPARARLRSAKRSRLALKVLEHGESVLLRNPWDVATQRDMAEAADTLGLPDLAIWLLEQARQKEPRSPALNRSLARHYEKRGNFALAIALWELVSQEEPADIEAQHKAKELAAANPVSPATNGSLNGRKPLQERFEADPTNVQACLDLAAYHRKKDQLHEAREVLLRGLGPTGRDFRLTLELAELEIEPFRKDLALTEDKLRMLKDDPELRVIHGRLEKEINTRELELWRLKADRFPGDRTHRLELGIRLLRAGQTDEAIGELQAVRTDLHHGWRALFHLGLSYQAKNNPAKAFEAFESALKALPEAELPYRKEILSGLADCAAQQGDYAAAVEWARELTSLDAEFGNIADRLLDWQRHLQAV